MHPNFFYFEWEISLFILGTVRDNQKGLPQAVIDKQVKLKCGEKVFRWKGNLLCLKWVDKRPVAMLSSIQQAVETQVKINYFGQPVIKPFVVHDYNMKMGGGDTTDNFLSHYITPKCFKWSKKLLLHFTSMVILNAYILNRKYGSKKCHILHTESILCSILLLHHLKQWHVRKGNLLFQLTILKRDSVVNTLFRNWTLLLGQKGKSLLISVKFAISYVNNLHIMATTIYNYPTSTLHMGVNCVLISLSVSHHVLKYFTLTSTTENRHLQTG